MKYRRSGLRRVLRWVGLGLFTLLTVTWIVGQFRTFAYRWAHWYCENDRGSIEVGRSDLRLGSTARGWYTDDSYGKAFLFSPVIPYLRVEGCRAVVLPFWLMLSVVGISVGLLWWRDRAPPKGHCQNCGYDLTGNVTGVCPECGTAR